MKEYHQPLHILHVLPTLDVGGMELVLARLINAMDGRGIRHSVIALKGDATAAKHFSPMTEIVQLKARRNELFLPWRLSREIKRLRPDVIHARNWGAWPDTAAARLLGLRKPPLVFSFHGLQGTEVWPKRRAVIGNLLSKMTRRIFTVSPAGAQVAARVLGLDEDRIDVIPNGVDLSRFTPTMREKTPAVFRIGTVGNYTSVKNQILLIQAVAALRREGLDVELKLAGEGPLRGELMAAMVRENLGDVAELMGHVSDIPEFLSTLDLFVLPSLSENHPNALIEAMAAGVPTVATDVGGVRWVLQDGRFGRLVPSNDLRAMVHTIRMLIDQPEQRSELAAAGRERVEKAFSLQRMADAYETLYRRAYRPPKRVVMLGPTWPLTGGMVSVLENLRTSRLAEEVNLSVVNTGKTTAEDRPLAAGIFSQLNILRNTLAAQGVGRTICHVHTCSGFSFWRDFGLMSLCRMLGARCMWHVHGGKFLEFLGGLNWMKTALSRLALGYARAGIILREDWIVPLNVRSGRPIWQVISNGVPIPPIPAPLTAGPMLFLGHLGQAKGAADLIRAVGKAKQAGRWGDVLIAGGEQHPGEKHLLEELIDQLDVRGKVCLAGVLGGESKNDALHHALALVLPSYSEAQPMAILEAMAAGLPVIATRVGEISRMVTDGVEGLLVEPGDVDGLAEAMMTLWQDESLRKTMGAAARVRAVRDYSIDATAGKILELYQKMEGK